MAEAIDRLIVEGIIDEALGRLKSGKEADVWLVRQGGRVVCAKVYKERENRSFKNNAGYKEGRQVRNTRTARAIAKGSKFGRRSEEEAWKSAEVDALYKLHAAGVRVPPPVMFYEGVLLMELVTDSEGEAAPRLIDVDLEPELAAAVYADLRAQVVGMLCAHLIHGDLSPYNVLMSAIGPVLIDFPQVVRAAANPQAEGYFVRDLECLRRHLATFAPALGDRAGDAREIWRAFVRHELWPGFVPTGRWVEPARPHHPPRPPAHPHAPRPPAHVPRPQPPAHAPRPPAHPHAPRPQAHAPRPQQAHPPAPRPQQAHPPRHPHGQRPRGQPEVIHRPERAAAPAGRQATQPPRSAHPPAGRQATQPPRSAHPPAGRQATQPPRAASAPAGHQATKPPGAHEAAAHAGAPAQAKRRRRRRRSGPKAPPASG